jgi:single-stranded DNA-binding protein
MRTIHLAGYVGQAHQNAMPSGDLVLNFSLAVNTGTKDKPETLWVDCALWGKRAESLAPYITKGKFLCVEGDAGIRTWLAKEDAGPRGTLTCRVNNITFGPRSDTTEAPAPPTAQAQKTGQAAPPLDDEIPF